MWSSGSGCATFTASASGRTSLRTRLQRSHNPGLMDDSLPWAMLFSVEGYQQAVALLCEQALRAPATSTSLSSTCTHLSCFTAPWKLQ